MRGQFLKLLRLLLQAPAKLGDIGTLVAPMFCPTSSNGIIYYVFVFFYLTMLLNFIWKAFNRRKAEYDHNRRLNSLNRPGTFNSIAHLPEELQKEIIKFYLQAP